MLKIIEWKSDYKVGIKEIDEQHKKFHGMLKDFYTVFMNGEDEKVLKEILDKVAAYALVHFATEEKYFDKYNYKFSKEHKQIHSDMKSKLSEFMKSYEKKEAEISVELLSFLIDWFIGHLTIEDRKYAKAFSNLSL